jgi:hypothetical protein
MKYNLVSVGDHSNITAFIDGDMYVADSDHPNFKAIVAAALANEEHEAVRLFDTSQIVAENFRKVSERVSIAGGKVYSLTQQIIRFLNEGVDDWRSLVNFYEKVASNPNEHSRTQLYTWLSNREFTITEEGDIIGYKGLENTSEGNYQSVSSGTATVNGVRQTGKIVQNLGDVVEMPRSSVQHDPQVGCHTGLHVGTHEYARDFVGGRGSVVLCIVNPRDIVSVPTDCSWAKVRTCRYILLAVAEGPLAGAVYSAHNEEENDNYDECLNCGEDKFVGHDLCDDCLDYENCVQCESCAGLFNEEEIDEEGQCDRCHVASCDKC